MSKYDIDKIRKKIKERSGRVSDPTEFRAPRLKQGETAKYRFYILPPLVKGEDCTGGKASETSDLYFMPNGYHYINKVMYQCPRIQSGDSCPVCQLGFDLMGETQDKQIRSKIARNYLAVAKYAINVYFTESTPNPDELRGKVMWYNAPKQVVEKFDECINLDDAGDPADPKAFGIFYDEEAAYVFQLEAKLNGDYNEYKESKFLPSLGKLPVAFTKKDNKYLPNNDRVAVILAQRHDLFKKFPPCDATALEKIAAQLANHDDSGGFDDDSQPAKAEEPKSKPKVESTKVSEPVKSEFAKTEPVKAESESAESDDIESLMKELEA